MGVSITRYVKFIRKGEDGADGNGIKSQTSLFVASNQSTGVTHDGTTGWQSEFIAPTQQKPYIWKCVQTIYTQTDTTFSAPELVAIWQSGANANLLDNAAFTDATNMGSWETISEYTAADGQTAPTPEIGKVDKIGTVEGRNSFYDTCKYLGGRIKYKNVLSQVVHNQKTGKPLKLVGDNWYTLSFWAKGWQQTISVHQSSSAYGFAKKDLYLIAGRTYTLAAYGYIDAAAQSEGKSLAIYVHNDGWSEFKSMEITQTSYELKTMEFTPKTTGVYHLSAYMYNDTRPSAGSVYLSWYKIVDNCDLSTYISPSAVDTTTKVFIDGVETTPSSDLSVTWKLSNSWTKHTISFKTKSVLTYADIQRVLFQLQPTPCEEAYRNIYICMPKLETGMMATGFIDNASDTKGDRGPALRGPQVWSDCATGYIFQAGASDEEYKDIVLYGNNYYSCLKQHAKSASNYPGSEADINSSFWKLADKLEIVATKILLAQYALVKNLGVETIDMKDTKGNIIFQAKDGNVICNCGTFKKVNVEGNFKSKNDTTWNEVEINSDEGYLVMRGPSGVDDYNHNLPSEGASLTDLFKLQFETDPDTLSRVAVLYMYWLNNTLRIDPIDGIVFENSGGDYLRINLTSGIQYTSSDGNTYEKTWENLLSRR